MIQKRTLDKLIHIILDCRNEAKNERLRDFFERLAFNTLFNFNILKKVGKHETTKK